MWWLNLSFIFDLVVQLVGNASDEFDNVVEVKKTKKQTKKKSSTTNPDNIHKKRSFQTEAQLGCRYCAINEKHTIY